jgi:phosphocarrier protein HPr
MPDTEGWLVQALEIVNERGLHARAAARLVTVAGQFDADITVSKDDHTVPARSIMGLLLLVAGLGSSITLAAKGHDAPEAIAAVAALVQNRFDEAK